MRSFSRLDTLLCLYSLELLEILKDRFLSVTGTRERARPEIHWWPKFVGLYRDPSHVRRISLGILSHGRTPKAGPFFALALRLITGPVSTCKFLARENSRGCVSCPLSLFLVENIIRMESPNSVPSTGHRLVGHCHLSRRSRHFARTRRSASLLARQGRDFCSSTPDNGCRDLVRASSPNEIRV